MRILSVEFIGAIGSPGQALPETSLGMPHVAVAGRSNVGKSSLLNRLVGRTRTPIARISSTPGKTQEVNFFLVRTDQGEFSLVDLPGYGFARAPEKARTRWAAMIDYYLSSTKELAGVIQLIDIRHGPTPDDLRAIDYLAAQELPVFFVMTKADKLKASKRAAAQEKIVDRLELDPTQVTAVSSLSGEGIDELVDTIGMLIESEALREPIE